MHWPSDVHQGGKLNFKNLGEKPKMLEEIVNFSVLIFSVWNHRIKLRLGNVQLFWPVVKRPWHSANSRFVAILWLLPISPVLNIQSSQIQSNPPAAQQCTWSIFTFLSFCSRFQQQSSCQQGRLDKDNTESFQTLLIAGLQRSLIWWGPVYARRGQRCHWTGLAGRQPGFCSSRGLRTKLNCLLTSLSPMLSSMLQPHAGPCRSVLPCINWKSCSSFRAACVPPSICCQWG